VAVAWQYRDPTPAAGSRETRYALTLWTPTRMIPSSARWVPRTLIRASPYPFSRESVRLADVTHDGDDDLLVTVMCSDCNHGAAAASIYGAINGTVRKIYGTGRFGIPELGRSGPSVQGRLLIETAWGAQDGLIWFDAGEINACCPVYRYQTFMRWIGHGHGWRTVSTRRVLASDDQLYRRGFPRI
jgi:hypothetical protein